MAGMNDKDYYAILGVDKDASAKDIQKAFQQKSRKLHPESRRRSSRSPASCIPM